MRSRGRSWLLAGTMALTMGAGFSVVGAGSAVGASHPLTGTYELFVTITSDSPTFSYTCPMILKPGGKSVFPASTQCLDKVTGHWSVTGSAVRVTNFHNEDIFTGKVTSKGFNTAFHPGTYSQIDPTATGTWYATYQS
jgi:hypothetical protein